MALQERVSFLEKQLVETKLQLADVLSDVDHCKTTLKTAPTSVAVPTADPFSRRSAGGAKRARTSARKVLNPGSCSSGINLLTSELALEVGSRVSLEWASRASSALDPSSRAASGLDLMMGSLASLSSVSLGLALRSARSGARLVGNARLMSLSYFDRDAGARDDGRLRGSAAESRASNRNADWDVIE